MGKYSYFHHCSENTEHCYWKISCYNQSLLFFNLEANHGPQIIIIIFHKVYCDITYSFITIYEKSCGKWCLYFNFFIMSLDFCNRSSKLKYLYLDVRFWKSSSHLFLFYMTSDHGCLTGLLMDQCSSCIRYHSLTPV